MPETRVLLAAMSLDLGGAETHVITLARELARRGRHVAVVSQGGRLTAGLESSGIAHYFAPLHSRSPLSLYRAVQAISALVQRERPDILHAHARIPAWACSVATRGKVPIVTTYHGVYAAGFPWNLVTVPGDLTVAVSEDVADHFVGHFGFDRNRIRVILNGIDTARFSPSADSSAIRTRFGISGHPLILHVSRLSGEFAHTAAQLIPAVAALLPDYPDLQSVIVGDGDRLDEIRSLAARVNESSGRAAVVVTGGWEDMPPVYAAADVVVGVARVALEAMSCGKPVVLAGEGGLRGLLDEHIMEDAVHHNFTARGCRRAVTPCELETELRQAMSDVGRRAELARNGRRIVVERYSIEKMVDDIESVYNEVSRMSKAAKP
ncbi:MAG: glycosyltransferase [Ignavibacteriales bacterium]